KLAGYIFLSAFFSNKTLPDLASMRIAASLKISGSLSPEAARAVNKNVKKTKKINVFFISFTFVSSKFKKPRDNILQKKSFSSTIFGETYEHFVNFLEKARIYRKIAQLSHH